MEIENQTHPQDLQDHMKVLQSIVVNVIQRVEGLRRKGMLITC